MVTRPADVWKTSLVMVLAAVCMLLVGSVERSEASKRSCHRPSCGISGGTTTGGGTTTTTTTGSTTPTSGSGGSLLWGAWIGTQFTGSEPPWDWNAVTAFQQQDAGGKHLSTLNWSSPFYSLAWCGGYCNFGTSMFQKVRDNGVIPFFSWADGGSSALSDAALAAGVKDDYIRRWAAAAAAWGHPLFLRYAWEMNGSWFTWGVGNGALGSPNTAADYVAAWRHVHDIFTSVGATNVSWAWCPNIDPNGKLADLASLYPGDSYVDWTCLDGYNRNQPWTSFTNLFASTYDKIMQIAPSKPMIIGEVGSTESGGSKAQWISDMFAALPTRFPNIRGLLWFDKYEDGWDMPIETSTSSSAAFASGVGSSAFSTNTFATLAASPIPAGG